MAWLQLQHSGHPRSDQGGQVFQDPAAQLQAERIASALGVASEGPDSVFRQTRQGKEEVWRGRGERRPDRRRGTIRQDDSERFKGFDPGLSPSWSAPPTRGNRPCSTGSLGEKISITSKKPQTTRNRILGVLHREGAQLVFMDTPGVHAASQPLNVRIVDQALARHGGLRPGAVHGRSHPSDARRRSGSPGKNQETVSTPVMLALNKTDLVSEPKPFSSGIDPWRKAYPFRGNGSHFGQARAPRWNDLVGDDGRHAAGKPSLFPEDALTDIPERFIAAEMIREKVFRLTGEEIPYAAAVTIETSSKKTGANWSAIHATIHVERDSQKGIVIGKQGVEAQGDRRWRPGRIWSECWGPGCF